ncbi:ecdysone-induced 78C-like [Brachionus plicatilis]|uniref:Ecdysone-induced 78C-like n=1 Tax=Brachionus plicatilis TaxID=10195 RepID=A0A3M7RD21_BRAPC|nr:ecdysone-induced 78C-like [Brachionus plicatilis]
MPISLVHKLLSSTDNSFNVSSRSENLVTLMIDTRKYFNQLNLNDIEIGILCGVIFTTTNEPFVNLNHEESYTVANRIRNDLLEALRFEISNKLKTSDNDKDDGAINNLIDNIDTFLKKISLIGVLHSENLQNYRTSFNSSKIPNLIGEIFELGKKEFASPAIQSQSLAIWFANNF